VPEKEKSAKEASALGEQRQEKDDKSGEEAKQAQEQDSNSGFVSSLSKILGGVFGVLKTIKGRWKEIVFCVPAEPVAGWLAEGLLLFAASLPMELYLQRRIDTLRSMGLKEALSWDQQLDTARSDRSRSLFRKSFLGIVYVAPYIAGMYLPQAKGIFTALSRVFDFVSGDNFATKFFRINLCASLLAQYWHAKSLSRVLAQLSSFRTRCSTV